MNSNLLLVSIGLDVAVVALVMVLLLGKNRSKDGGFARLESRLMQLQQGIDKLENVFRQEASSSRTETNLHAKQTREELLNGLHHSTRQSTATIESMFNQQKHLLDSFAKQLAELTKMNEQKLENVRSTVSTGLKSLQDENAKKLDEMRATVDEKLHATLEKRLGESFKLVSDRLELVHKGLGEMQSLASGVGDLKRVLTNVKARGIVGEIQLENLLEQILTSDQYAKNVTTKMGTNERVEFAVKLPSRDENGPDVLLPLDSKFPLEDYQRLLEAQEAGDPALAQEAAKQLEVRIKASAKEIHDKYINPPHTTDFAILFLPIEGLFAEVLRKSGLWEVLQREYHVVITGPTTLAALLNSLQMGFRTLAIQKRSGEVWNLLAAVKSEFGKFGTILDKTQKKLQEATNSIEEASRKTRTIERKLRDVEALPSAQSEELLLLEHERARSE